MPEPIPHTLDALDRLTDDALAYIDAFIAGLASHEPERLAAAWHAVFTRETRGAYLPLLVTWTHPAGGACVDLPGPPSPHAIVLALPAAPPALRPLIAHLHITQAPLYMPAEIFTLPPDEQRLCILTGALEQQLDASPLETQP